MIETWSIIPTSLPTTGSLAQHRIWFVSAVTGETTIAANAYPTQLQKQQET